MTTPIFYVTMCWQEQDACSRSTLLLLKSVHHLLSRKHNEGSESLCKVSAHQRAALYAAQLCCCRGLFSAWNRMVCREHSGGWALQCTAVLVALLCTPTLFHSCSACDSLSISYSIFQTLSRPCLNHLSCLLSPFLLSSQCVRPFHAPFSPHY